MKKIKLEQTLSPFGQTALELDHDFQLFAKLADELERAEVGSDKGFEKAAGILVEFDACRQRIGTGMQKLSAVLVEARQKMDGATEIASKRALEIQVRRENADALLEKFRLLGNMVQDINTAVSQLRKSESDVPLLDEDRAAIQSRLAEFNTRLGAVVEEAVKLKEEAHAANMKDLERNADSLRQTLLSTSNKLNLFVNRQELQVVH